MKLTLFLAFVAVTASVVYAAPQGDDEEIAIQEFLEKALKQSPQENNEKQELQAQLQSLLAEMEQDSKGTLQDAEATAKRQRYIPGRPPWWIWRWPRNRHGARG